MDEILSLFTRPMACHPEHYKALKMALFTALRNGTLDKFQMQINKDVPKFKLGILKPETFAIQIVENYEVTDASIPENSVALITLEGTIYPYKAFMVEQLVQAANANPNIVGILFFVNTPGGYVHRVDITSQAIKESQKPTAVYVTGLCASAGMFMFCGADRIFAASPFDIFGSIGTMTTFINDSKFWEDNGFIETNIYATLSTKKNHAARQAENGNFQPMIDSLDFYNKIFHETISENLNIPFDTENDVFKGAEFNTEKAIVLGLAHEIRNLNDALDWVLKEGLKFKANNNNF